MKKKIDLLVVTDRAAIQRINRAVRMKNQRLVAAEGAYHLVSTAGEGVIRRDVVPKDLAKELGLIESWEA